MLRIFNKYNNEAVNEKNKDKDSFNKEDENYKNTKILLKLCEDEYFRVINFYSKIYDKVNITLVFLAALLTVATTQMDFHYLLHLRDKISLGEIIIVSIKVFCQLSSYFIFSYSLISLIRLLRGESIRVLKIDDIIKIKDMNLKEISVCKWLIKQYAYCISENTKTMQKKQSSFNKILRYIYIGIILWLFSIALQGVV